MVTIDNIVVYQDDILIMSSDTDSHCKTLRTVLTTLKNAGIKINFDKCNFFASSVKYLGYVFSNDNVSPDTEKVRAIIDAPEPTNLKQVQAFAGMINYYSRFIPNFSCIMSPLYSLMKKDVQFKWGPDQQRSFNKLKFMFKQNVWLRFFNPTFDTMLETDASGYGISAVLFQRADSSYPWLPVQCTSRTLNNAEKNYSNIEREALSVVFGVEKFKHFLLGTKFLIRNDQKPLVKLFAHNLGVSNSCSARIQRWSLKLSQYNYVFEYSRGVDNVMSDCLSRLPLPCTVKEYEPYELVCNINEIESGFITCEQIAKCTNEDPDLIQLKQFIKFGAPSRIRNPNLTKFNSVLSKLSILRSCIMFNNRIFIPKPLRTIVLEQFHDNHPGISGMKSLARSLIWFPGMDKEIEYLVRTCNVCQSVRSKPCQNNRVQWPTPCRVWSRLHIDHFFIEGKTCLIVVDASSKYIEVELVSNTSVKETIDALRVVFSRNGLCDIVVSDNASCFTAGEFQSFLNANGIKHLTPPPYSPATNGQAERGVRVVKDLLKKYNTGESLKSRLAKVLFHYRSTPHNTTLIAPSVVLNNRKFVTVKDRLNPHYSYNNNSNVKFKQIPDLLIGDNVLALNVREGPKWLKAIVTEKVAINIYNVHVVDLNIVWKRHITQLLKVPSISYVDPVIIESNKDNLNIRRSSRISRPPVRYPN